jgi:hypothetical protein
MIFFILEGIFYCFCFVEGGNLRLPPCSAFISQTALMPGGKLF